MRWHFAISFPSYEKKSSPPQDRLRDCGACATPACRKFLELSRAYPQNCAGREGRLPARATARQIAARPCGAPAGCAAGAAQISAIYI
ncbi:hypothetical protein COL27_30165 [Bacillus sp. AFS075960]|nr:hypothetical protein COL27_30165 [Bacillus sp. AFS075960]